MTKDNLNKKIDIVLKHFEKDRQINIRTFLPIVTKGFPLQEVLEESVKRELICLLPSIDKDERIYQLTDTGERVLHMGGWTKHLNHEIEMKRLTLETLIESKWSTRGQFVLAFLVAIATLITSYITIVEHRHQKAEKELSEELKTGGLKTKVLPGKQEKIKLDSSSIIQDTLPK